MSLFLLVTVLLLGAVMREPLQTLFTKAAPNNTVSFNTAVSKLSSNTALSEFFPNVAVDDRGITHIVYIQGLRPSPATLMYTNNASGTFAPPKAVDDIIDHGDDGRPELIVHNGQLHLFYTVKRVSLRYRIGDLNGNFGGVIPIREAVSGRSVYNGGFAFDNAGKPHFVYISDQLCNGQFNVYYRKFDGASVGPESSFMPCVASTKSRPRIAYANGKMHVVVADVKIYYASIDVNGGGWSTPVALSHIPEQRANSPELISSGNTLYVAWASFFNANNIYFRYSLDAGASWSGVLPVADSPNFSQFPSLVWIPSPIDRGYIIWMEGQSNGSTVDVHFHEFDPVPVSFTNPVKLTCMAVGNRGYANIAAGGNHAHIVFQGSLPAQKIFVYHLGGQIGAGLTTSGCGAAPTAGPPVDGPTATTVPGVPTSTTVPVPPSPTKIPTPTATSAPTATPRPTATPTEVPTPTFTPIPTFTPTPYPVGEQYGKMQFWIIVFILGALVLTITHSVF